MPLFGEEKGERQPLAANNYQPSVYDEDVRKEFADEVRYDAAAAMNRNTLPKLESRWDRIKTTYALVLWLTLLFISSVGENVLRKKTLIHGRNYGVAFALLGSTAACVVFGLMSIFVPPLNRHVNPLHAVVIGLCFALFNMLQNVGASGTAISGSFVLLTQKLLALFSVALATLIRFTKVNTRIQMTFDWMQWIAVALLVVGIVPVYLTESAGLNFDLFRFMLLVISVVPLSGGFLYVEHLLKTLYPTLNVIVLWFWATLFQSILLIPLGMLMVELNAEIFAGQKFWPNFKAALICLYQAENTADNDDCDGVPIYGTLALVFSILMNIAMPSATRLGGAARMWLVRALSLPMATFMFTMKWLMGSDYSQTLKPSDLVGLGLVMLAMGMYEHKTVRGLLPALPCNPFKRKQAAPTF
eukprot:TRINITY_DN79968_c0_g1_i1.p1 TRINITY_DN79968_c0_g1~~TRINITY_DN79968_c0_g1_i1.p1  ORF type:complete len:415 (+),score=60.96 TRINITY_DN79968_c0_g1_i1:44-1288(+)